MNKTWETTKACRGKATFLTNPEFPRIAPVDILVTVEKKPHGMTPTNRYSPKAVNPDGSPVGATDPNRVPKTKEYRVTVASGLRSDHVQPKNDRRYFVRNSRKVKLMISSRDSAARLTLCLIISVRLPEDPTIKSDNRPTDCYPTRSNFLSDSR
jgi:hypothetical protein